MKTFNEIKIDNSNVLKDEDLLLLKGGDMTWCGECVVSCPGATFGGPCCEGSRLLAETMCGAYWGEAGCTCYAYS